MEGSTFRKTAVAAVSFFQVFTVTIAISRVQILFAPITDIQDAVSISVKFR